MLSSLCLLGPVFLISNPCGQLAAPLDMQARNGATLSAKFSQQCKLANITGTNSQLRGEKTKTKSNVNRKGPSGKLCVTGIEVQTQSRRPACSEPSWACHICLSTGFKPHKPNWWFSTSVFHFLPPCQWVSTKTKFMLSNKKDYCLKHRWDLKPTSPSFPQPPTSHLLLPKNHRYHRTVWKVPSQTMFTQSENPSYLSFSILERKNYWTARIWIMRIMGKLKASSLICALGNAR